jgi:hypothetical protein
MKKEMIATIGMFCAASLFAQEFNEIGEASKQPHPFEKSIANMRAEQQRAAAAEAARLNAYKRGLTGDAAYDNLPDVKRRRLYENMERQKQEYLKSRPDLIQRKDQATTRRVRENWEKTKQRDYASHPDLVQRDDQTTTQHYGANGMPAGRSVTTTRHNWPRWVVWLLVAVGLLGFVGWIAGWFDDKK